MWNPRFAHAEPTPAGFTIYANIQKYDRIKKKSTPRAKMVEMVEILDIKSTSCLTCITFPYSKHLKLQWCSGTVNLSRKL